jgi:LysR family hydrogen peroxide-inducible transcriptional activator
MEMHQLRYVAAVARTGNFSRAAEQCHVSQPSLSQQIRKLEDELGQQLFNRTRRQAKLTSHGQAFLYRAMRILDEVEAAKREAIDAQSLLRGTLTVGVLPTIAPFLLPEAMAAFTDKYPGLDIVVQEDTTARLVKLLVAQELDLALASEPIPPDHLHVQKLFVEELLLALPPGHPLTREHKIRCADLQNERFIVMQEGHCLGEQVCQFCASRELRANVAFRSAQLETVQALVRAGVGISLIPAMATHSNRDDLPEYRSLSGQRPQRTIVAVWPKKRPLSGQRPQRTIVAVWPKKRPLGRAAAEFLQAIRPNNKNHALWSGHTSVLHRSAA